MKKDTFYFSHDYNANSDVKILFLRQQLGMEGYGIYWMLIESLANAGGFLPMKIIPVFAMQMQTSQVKVESVINEFGLFAITNNGFLSDRLNGHLELRKTLSDKGREGAIKRWENHKKDSPPISPPNGEGNAKESKVKESKIKERKGEFKKTLTPYLEKYGKDMLNNFYSYWTEHGEKDIKMRFEKQVSFSIARRLATWKKGEKNNAPAEKILTVIK